MPAAFKSRCVPADPSEVNSGNVLPDTPVPVPVPDRLTIWPMDDSRYGLDASFQGVRVTNVLTIIAKR